MTGWRHKSRFGWTRQIGPSSGSIQCEAIDIDPGWPLFRFWLALLAETFSLEQPLSAGESDMRESAIHRNIPITSVMDANCSTTEPIVNEG